MNEYYPSSVLKIPNATPETRDAAQYMFRHGRKQYNLCGEFCVAYCARDETGSNDIDEFLNYWEAKDLKWYQTVFKNGLSRTTGIYDLKIMLDAYEAEYIPLNIGSYPLGYLAMLEKYQLIVGVSIDHTGYLVGLGIRHWVVLERILVIDNNHAICDVYNPFTNAMEAYSWREIMTSTGSYKQGIWIER